MEKRIKVKNLLIVGIFLTFQVKADSWIDPSWKEMVYSSDVIALVQYASSGKFRAKAKPLTIYKGQLTAPEIWISGFSNQYGPIDKMSPGDKFIVFLNFYKPTEKALEYWTKQIKERPELTSYFEALKDGNVYYVWSPTSGDLKVKGAEVQYDLLQTSYHSKQSFYPLKEFEDFLRVTAQKDKAEFHEQTLEKIKSNLSNEKSAQYLMMLYLSSFQEYDPIFEKVADTGFWSAWRWYNY